MEDQLQHLLARLATSATEWDEFMERIRLRQFDPDQVLGASCRAWSGEMLTLINALAVLSRLTDFRQIALLVVKNALTLMKVEYATFYRWQAGERKFEALDDSVYFEPQQNSGNGSQLDLSQLLTLLDGDQLAEQDWLCQAGDPALSAAWQEIFAQTELSFFSLLAVKANQQLVGGIVLADRRTDYAYQDYQVAMTQLLASCAGAAVARTRVFVAAKRRVQELESLRKVSLSLTSSLDLQQVLDHILKHALQVIEHAQDAHIFLYEENQLRFKSALWADGRTGQPWANPREDGLTYTVAKKGELILVRNMRTHALYAGAPEMWAGSIVGLPLKIGQRVVGVMTIAHPQINAFLENELRLLRLLGDQAAVAIENARLHNLVNQQARTDMLTRLPNRRAFNERLMWELRRTKRYGPPFSLAVMDLDGFKKINDLCGHPRGDEVLRMIAAHMQGAIRDTDFLARFGGDEFVVLLTEADADIAHQMMSRLQQVVETLKIECDDHPDLSVGISYGCATYPRDTRNLDDLYRIADEALYLHKAKQSSSR